MQPPPSRPLPLPPTLSRRALAVGGLGLAGLLITLGACGDKDGDSAGDGGADGGGGDGGSTGDGGSDGGGSSGDWATGGTASMSGDYPDPFLGKTATACALYCEMTLGPCYAETMERKDISEGVGGLPMRLAFQVVDEECTPVEGAIVDVWHTAPNGLYSGEEAAEMCTTGDSAAMKSSWFRGIQVSGKDGRVDFDSCFPGWYSGRTIHIHFQVRRGADVYTTSQLYFAQDLIDGILASHPEYSGRGPANTSNDEDGILGSTEAAPYLMETARMDDGALMASKRLVIRASLADASCSA